MAWLRFVSALVRVKQRLLPCDGIHGLHDVVDTVSKTQDLQERSVIMANSGFTQIE